MKAFAFWLGTSALSIALCGTAVAQDAPADQQQQQTGNDEIVVTATRRTEPLRTSPLSASVISGQQLDERGITNGDALQFATPSVVVNNFGQGNDFNVRGVGKGEHNTQTTTGVITYRDGVPSFPGYFQLEPYYDVANIQILRGPQGTIVGQNATGGAVFVNTNDPVIGGGVHGYVQAQYGNYNDLGAQGAVNLPISDTFAARVAFFGERRDGFYNVRGPGGVRYEAANNRLGFIAGRFSFLWKPTDRLTILSKTDLDYLDSGAYPASPATNTFRFLPYGSTTPNPNYADLFDITANSPAEARDKFVRSILRVEYEFAGGTRFRSVSGIQNGNTRYRSDLDGTATGNNTFFDNVTETQFTQEVNLISPDDQRFTWLLGAFGVWNTYFFLPPYQFVIGVPPGSAASEYRLQGRNRTRSYAAFGGIGFRITPTLKLDAGLRYTDSSSINYVDVLQYGTPILANQTTTSDNLSYKVSLGWEVSNTQYLYGFVATGFRPGGLNVPVGFGNPAPFLPEEITSYELGWKGSFAGGRVRGNLTGFYNDYRNFQVTIGNPTLPVFGLEVNVPGNTKIYGVEAELELRLGRFSLNAGVSVLHSEIGTFYATDPRAATLTPCNPNTGPASATCLNLGGRRQTYAPNFTFNIGGEYQFVLGNGDRIIPRANFGHVGNQWATLFQNPARGDRIGDRNILNAQIAYQHGSLTVTAYATNLTDQHYAGALNSGLYFAGPPRQYGIRVLKTF